MNCVGCGLDAGYNRVFVDTVTDAEVGGFCLRCEESEFGRCLERGDWTTADGCVLCDRDGFYALPAWTPYCEEVDGRTVCKVDYRVDDATLRFCDEHFLSLCNGVTAAHPGRVRRSDTRPRE